MTELSNWVWLIVAGIWIVARILPRLFRSRSGKGSPEPAKTRNAGKTPPEPRQTAPTSASRRDAYPAGLDVQGRPLQWRSKGDGPQPIEPK